MAKNKKEEREREKNTLELKGRVLDTLVLFHKHNAEWTLDIRSGRTATCMEGKKGGVKQELKFQNMRNERSGRFVRGTDHSM